MSTKGENREDRLKKITYRAHHRGTQEMDIILGGYVDDVINDLSDQELDELELLMSEQDVDLLNWITGAKPIDEASNTDLIKKIAAHQMRRFEG